MWVSATVAIAFLVMALTLRIPSVQTYSVNKIIGFIEGKTGHQITLGYVSIRWFDRADFRNFLLYDLNGQVMLRTDRVRVDFDLFDFYSDRSLQLDGIYIDSADLFLAKYSDSTSINASVFLKSLGSDKSKPLKITADIFEIDKLRLQFENHPAPHRGTDYFDHNHFNFSINSLLLNEVVIDSGRINMRIFNFDGRDVSSGFEFTSFSSDLAFTQKNLVLSNARIETPHSTIGDSLSFSYSSPAVLAYMTDSVDLDWKLKDVRIGHRDLAYFGNIGKWREPVLLDGTINGKVKRLHFKNSTVKLRDESRFYGNVSFYGLPRLENTFIDLDVQNAHLKEKRVQELASRPDMQIGDLHFSGQLIGFLNDFVAQGVIDTKAGLMSSDLNLKFGKDLTTARYRGSLSLKDFEPGLVLEGLDMIDKINFEGQVDGIGLTRNSADFNLKATVRQTKILNHHYDYASTDGRFRSNFFSGNVEIMDTSLVLSGQARIDFSTPTEIIDIDVSVDSADLFVLGISKKPLVVTADIRADLQELNINESRGMIVLDKIEVDQGAQSVKVSDIEIEAINNGKKKYTVRSDDLQAILQGEFRITDLLRDIPQNAKEYHRIFTEGYNRQPGNIDTMRTRSQYSAQLDIKAPNLNTYLDFVGIPFNFSDDFEFSGSFNQNHDARFSIFVKVDTFRLGNREFIGNTLELDASKDIDSLGVLALMQLVSKEQKWDVVSSTVDFSSESVWSDNELKLNLSLKQPKNGSEADLNTKINLLQDTIQVKLLSSTLKAFDKPWDISRSNVINILEDRVIVKDIQLYNQSQSVRVDGVVSDSLATQLNIDFENFEMRNISAILPKNFDGVLNGTAKLTRVSANDPFMFNSESTINNLKFEGIHVGDLNGRSYWDREVNGLSLNYNLQREEVNTIQLSGHVKPFDEDQVDIKVKFDQANFNIIEPFFSAIISNVAGYASGDIKITGLIKAPRIDGKAQLENGVVTLDYLNTTYHFSGDVSFEDQNLKLLGVQVLDRFDNQAKVVGSLSHRNFRNFHADVVVDHENFELLNTTISQNSLYYGNAYSTGRIELIGPVENILIKANVTTAPGTRIYFPFTDNSQVHTQEYITFINAGDSVEISESAEDVDLTGITLDFNVNVTEDAYSELIFNPRTGDIIRGRGNGNLQLNIDSNGEFKLFGSLQVKQGAYNFTTSIINKEFQLVPDGTISWYGDPYQGELNLEATYRQIADPNDWRTPEQWGDISNVQSPGQGQSASNLSQRSPVSVVLGLTGQMMNPEIDFRLEMEDQSGGDQIKWRNLLAIVNSNEEELKRQVFSLLMLGKFSYENEFVVGGSLQQGIGSSVSEFVSNQLSYWLNQVDDNLEISFDLDALDQDALNTFQLRLAYTFLDGRLRITRGGGVTTVVDEGKRVAENIIGDWSVEYLLTESGKLRIKVFSRSDQVLSQDIEQQTGVSVQYVQSFDEFREFLGLSKNNTETAPSISSSGDSSQR